MFRFGKIIAVSQDRALQYMGTIAPDDGGENIFFHCGDRRPVSVNKEGFIYFDMSGGVIKRVPVEGEKVVFEIFKPSKKGPRAQPWNFLAQYDAVIEPLPLLSLGRVVEVSSTEGPKPTRLKVLWKGRNPYTQEVHDLLQNSKDIPNLAWAKFADDKNKWVQCPCPIGLFTLIKVAA